MATQVVMPKLSPTMEERQLSRWLKKEGDKVSMGEPLAEIDAGKTRIELRSVANGVVLKILANDCESTPVGEPVAIVVEEGEDMSDIIGGKKSAKEESPKAKPKTEEAEEKEPEPKKAEAAESKPAPKEEAPRPVTTSSRDDGRQLISPIAARMAAEAGINLKSLQGSGPGGRIVKRDVEDAISGKIERIPTAPRLRAVPLRPLEKGEVYAPSAYRDEPASEMRRTIAKRLVTSLGPVPHFFLTTEIDMERAADLRRAINELYPDAKISINDVIIKVTAAALIQHPQVNASFQEKHIRFYEHADLGVAVATENGLITPVVRSADLKSLPEIGAEIRELADRARARKLRPEEYTGATFSISNLGMFGIDEFTAVINPPEGAILAIGALTPHPVVRDGQVVIRQTMRVTMSCDHRVVDGATGAQFLQSFKQVMENPLYLFLAQ